MGVIVRQGSKQAIVKIVGVLIGFISLLLIYPLDHASYGYAAFILSAATLLTPLLAMGLSQSAIKFFPEYLNETSDRKGFIWILFALHLIPLLLCGIFFYFFDDSMYSLIGYMGLDVTLFRENSSVIVIVSTLLLLYMTITSYISNFGRIVIPTIINEFSYKLFLPLVVLGVVYGVVQKNIIPGLMIAFFAIALIVLMVYLAKLGGISRKVDLSFLTSRKLKRIGKYSLYSALGTLGSLLIFRIDAVMITGLLGEVSTGLYFNILVMAAVIDIPSQAIGKIAGPIISKSFNDNNHEEIQSIYIKGSINSLIVGMLIFLGIWFNLDAIISLSSKPEAFFGATQIFLFLGIAKLIDGLTGINTHILLYSKYYKFNLLFLLCLGVLNVFLNLVLIKKYDIAGAAMATLISLTLYNLIKLFFIKFTLDMSPFTLDTLKVLLIGVIVFGLLFILPMPDSVVLGILLRSILISVLFIGSIYLSKASIDFNSLVDKYTKIIIR